MNDHLHNLDLSPQDAELLDRLVEVNFDLKALNNLSDEEIARANNILTIFGLLETYPVVDACDTLVYATLARVSNYDAQYAERFCIDTNEIAPTLGGFKIRIPDFISVAAVLLIVASVFIMVGQNARARSVSNQCASNMAMVGQGLLNYAADHNGAMPTEEASNLALFFGDLMPYRTAEKQLVNLGYCDINHLNCPGHGGEESGFSYQTQPKELWTNLQQSGRVIILLSDRNPILEKMLLGQQYNPLARSKNHGSLGQNQLQDDGSTKSITGPPVIAGDKIWILDGSNRPIDIFLTH